MDFTRDIKIGRYVLESFSIKKKKDNAKRKIKFRINGFEFISDLAFEYEKDFYEFFFSGRYVICKHVFEKENSEPEITVTCNLWLEGEKVVILIL